MDARHDVALPDGLVAGWGRLSRVVNSEAALLRGMVARWPWWVRVLMVWALARGFSAWLTVLAGASQADTPWSRSGASYIDMADTWDAAFYREIHDHGYPAELPRSPSGEVLGSPWAFLPLYPAVVRAVTALTGLDWIHAAPMVSTVASAAFVLVCYRLFSERADAGTALTAVAAVSVWPASPVMQFDYAESLAMLLVAVVVLLLSRGRFLLATPVVVLAGLTRPIAAPLAAAVVLFAVLSWWAHRRAGRPLPIRSTAALVLLVVVSVAAVGLWPGVAASVSGEPDAYFLTEAAWHFGRSQLATSHFLLSFMLLLGPVPGAAVAVAVVIALVIAVWSPPARALGAAMWAWSVAYLAYLLALVGWEAPVPRLLLLAFPLALPMVAASRARPYRVLLVLSLAVLQVFWLFLVWRWVPWEQVAP